MTKKIDYPSAPSRNAIRMKVRWSRAWLAILLLPLVVVFVFAIIGIAAGFPQFLQFFFGRWGSPG
jgi:uncharacterized integral membrane protein